MASRLLSCILLATLALAAAADESASPSALAVMLGSLAGISIERLLIGGILPGMLMAAGFLAYVVVRSRLRPQDAPMSDDDPATRLKGWALW